MSNGGIAVTREGRIKVHADGLTIDLALSPPELRAFAAELRRAADRMEKAAAATTDTYIGRASASARKRE